MITIIVLIFLILFLLCFVIKSKDLSFKETFLDFVGYNTSIDGIKKYKNIDNSYNSQTIDIKNLLDKANKNNKYYNDDDINVNNRTGFGEPIDTDATFVNQNGYTLYNKNIDFPLSKMFKNIITEYLINNNILGNKLYISGDISNMYIKDVINRP